jgi:hypothetical protein
MSQYPALETEIEKAIREDRDGAWVKELKRSFSDFTTAVEFHTRDGVSMEQYLQWQELIKAAHAAGEVAEEVRLRIHDK